MISQINFIDRALFEWGVRCFGPDQMTSPPARALRLAEEAIEFAQAVGVPEDKMHLLVRTVYSRPPGEPAQEIGGVLVTAHLAALTLGQSPEEFFEMEALRVFSKDTAHFKQRNEEKNALGLRVD